MVPSSLSVVIEGPCLFLKAQFQTYVVFSISVTWQCYVNIIKPILTTIMLWRQTIIVL